MEETGSGITAISPGFLRWMSPQNLNPCLMTPEPLLWAPHHVTSQRRAHSWPKGWMWAEHQRAIHGLPGSSWLIGVPELPSNPTSAAWRDHLWWEWYPTFLWRFIVYKVPISYVLIVKEALYKQNSKVIIFLRLVGRTSPNVILGR